MVLKRHLLVTPLLCSLLLIVCCSILLKEKCAVETIHRTRQPFSSYTRSQSALRNTFNAFT